MASVDHLLEESQFVRAKLKEAKHPREIERYKKWLAKVNQELTDTNKKEQ